MQGSPNGFTHFHFSTGEHEHAQITETWKHDDPRSWKEGHSGPWQSISWKVRRSFAPAVQQEFTQAVQPTDQNSSVFVAIPRLSVRGIFFIFF